MTGSQWRALQEMLDRLEQNGRQARLWLRDDDATEPTAALDRLIDLCETHAIPLLLAVIPETATAALATRLRPHPLVHPCQHGFNHRNHSSEGARACELGGDRPIGEVLEELAHGAARLSELCFDARRPVLVPPWNRIEPTLRPHLPSLGYTAISTFGRQQTPLVPKLAEINADLDIINWRKGRIGRDHDDLIGKLIAELETTLVDDRPIGVLGHHLVHDETAWAFLTKLFALTNTHAAVRWLSIDELISWRSAA